jgi:hypothetical protein
MRSFQTWLAAGLTLGSLMSCASAPPVESGSGSASGAVWGYVRLVPREGVAEATGGAHAYGDRDLTGAQLVDYSTPGFAVVYAEGDSSAGERAPVAVVMGPTGVRLEPPHAALGVGGTLSIANQTSEAHVISCPRASLVRPLSPGESTEIAVDAAGEWPVFLLDVPGEQARVFAAPGPYQVVSPTGRFELEEIPPGNVRLHAWHPRFPGASAQADVLADDSVQVDFELRVDRMEGSGGE